MNQPTGSESEQDSPLVVVSVGTDHHPFGRLVDWSSEWAADNPACRMIIQRGSAEAPEGIESHSLIAHDELRRLFSAASVVVSHGGPSTVMDARMVGRLPIVVPRDDRLGEHVDDHQRRFAAHLENYGLAHCATTRDAYRALLDKAVASPAEFTITCGGADAPAGVVMLGRVLDDLLGIRTDLAPRGVALFPEMVVPEAARES